MCATWTASSQNFLDTLVLKKFSVLASNPPTSQIANIKCVDIVLQNTTPNHRRVCVATMCAVQSTLIHSLAKIIKLDQITVMTEVTQQSTQAIMLLKSLYTIQNPWPFDWYTLTCAWGSNEKGYMNFNKIKILEQMSVKWTDFYNLFVEPFNSTVQ